jgi:hypothetical protein
MERSSPWGSSTARFCGQGVDVDCPPVIAGVGERVNEVRRDSGVLGWLRLRVSLPVTTIGSDWRCCGRRRDPVDIRLVVLKILKTNRWFSEVRNCKGKRTVPERRLEIQAARRNRRNTVVVAATSGELFRQPGGMIWRGKKGVGRGECGLYIGTGWGETAGV